MVTAEGAETHAAITKIADGMALFTLLKLFHGSDGAGLATTLTCSEVAHAGQPGGIGIFAGTLASAEERRNLIQKRVGNRLGVNFQRKRCHQILCKFNGPHTCF